MKNNLSAFYLKDFLLHGEASSALYTAEINIKVQFSVDVSGDIVEQILISLIEDAINNELSAKAEQNREFIDLCREKSELARRDELFAAKYGNQYLPDTDSDR